MGYIFNIERDIKIKLSQLNNDISTLFLDTVVYIESSIDKYIYQIQYINQLKDLNQKNNDYKLLYDIKTSQLNELNKLQNIDYKQQYSFEKTRGLSYYKFDDFSKIIIDYPVSNEKKIYALLTYDGFSAGIVINKDDQNVAYLNNNIKCNYSVYIGDSNAPGITSGMDKNGLIIIKYVPLWKNIKKGDDIISSGMDNIFPFGIKVGKVEDIKIGDTTQEIYAKPYSDVLGKRDFYIYYSNK